MSSAAGKPRGLAPCNRCHWSPAFEDLLPLSGRTDLLTLDVSGPAAMPVTTPTPGQISKQEDAMNSKRLEVATLIGGGLAALTVGVAAPVVGAPNDADSAQDIVTQLRQEGYKVIIDKMGHGSLEKCKAENVRTVSSTGETVVILQNPSKLGIPQIHGARTMTAYVHVHC